MGVREQEGMGVASALLPVEVQYLLPGLLISHPPQFRPRG